MTDSPEKMARRCAKAAAGYILGNRWILASPREWNHNRKGASPTSGDGLAKRALARWAFAPDAGRGGK